MRVKIVKTDKAKTPIRAYKGDAGYDVAITGFSKIFDDGKTRKLVPMDVEQVSLRPGERTVCNTGICLALPENTYVDLRLRSSMGLWEGLYIPNAPCTFDSGYRNEYMVVVANGSLRTVTLKTGERIGQLILLQYESMEFEEVEQLPSSERGKGGYGSSGK